MRPLADTPLTELNVAFGKRLIAPELPEAMGSHRRQGACRGVVTSAICKAWPIALVLRQEGGAPMVFPPFAAQKISSPKIGYRELPNTLHLVVSGATYGPESTPYILNLKNKAPGNQQLEGICARPKSAMSAVCQFDL